MKKQTTARALLLSVRPRKAIEGVSDCEWQDSRWHLR